MDALWKTNGSEAAAEHARMKTRIEALEAELTIARRDRQAADNRVFMMTEVVTNSELKLAEKHCEWPAFRHAFNAVMKARRAALKQD